MNNIRPYGDTLNDGRIQLSFTLPIECGEKAKEVAKILLKQMGFDEIEICLMQDLTPGRSQAELGNEKLRELGGEMPMDSCVRHNEWATEKPMDSCLRNNEWTTEKQAGSCLRRNEGTTEKPVGDPARRSAFTHFVAYVTTRCEIDTDKVTVKAVKSVTMDMDAIDDYIDRFIGREITVVGACIESDAHTVGIDAIMNMKGYNHRYGLERYRNFIAYNMGAQVLIEDLVQKAIEVNADAILVSQVVTQKNIHISNLTRLIELAEAENIRDKMLFICGGPRIGNDLAIELGYDAGFGSGSYANDVAEFIATRLAEDKDLK